MTEMTFMTCLYSRDQSGKAEHSNRESTTCMNKSEISYLRYKGGTSSLSQSVPLFFFHACIILKLISKKMISEERNTHFHLPVIL